MAELIKKEINVPRELQEVLDCLKVIVKSIKNGSSIGEVIEHALPKFITAVEGAQSIPTEIKDEMKSSIDAALLFGSEVAFLFLGKEEAKAVAAPVVPVKKISKNK